MIWQEARLFSQPCQKYIRLVGEVTVTVMSVCPHTEPGFQSVVGVFSELASSDTQTHTICHIESKLGGDGQFQHLGRHPPLPKISASLIPLCSPTLVLTQPGCYSNAVTHQRLSFQCELPEMTEWLMSAGKTLL